MTSAVRYCYCQVEEKETYMLCCEECKIYFHARCLKSGRPSSLLGDTFFKFVCENCSPTGQELCERHKLQWTQVLLLSLYNLQFEGGGKCGYFRWREQVCSFVDRHWTTFFGSKKKTNTWHGTVAGTLSAGCPHFFKSGTADLGEAGWWALNVSKIPGPEEFESQCLAKSTRKQKSQAAASQSGTALPMEGLRHRKHKNAILAAMELKEKRSMLPEVKSIRRKDLKVVAPVVESESEVFSREEPCFSGGDISSIDVCTVPTLDNVSMDAAEMFLDMDFEIAQEEELGLELDLDRSSPIFHPESPPISELLSTLSSETLREEAVEEEVSADESSPTSSRSASRMESTEGEDTQPSPVCRKRKIKQEEQTESVDEPTCILMSVYEEHELLKKLEKFGNVVDRHPAARKLRRKLAVRQKQREMNRQVFDLDAFMRQESTEQKMSHRDVVLGSSHLDRYMMAGYNLSSRTRISFIMRLMGLEEEQMESTTSPYTLRNLKPFIFRDYETIPLKLKLLQEICAYPHRNDDNWKPSPRKPIDYCYVRPHHIPAANAMCQEFFWPGIDLSECLQYPDFSCIALYRKLVIGFAFMVPDVGNNETYISFIFTHPEWRNAGIATFMLYHLIQTCMGKDVTLHVSATSPACFLYQKFGFKVEEFILDFYNKYLPANSKDCKNAFFLRLSR